MPTTIRPGMCHRHAFGQRCVGDADEHGHPAVDQPHDAVHEVPLDRVGERRSLPGRAEHEETVHAADKHVIDEPFETGDVEHVRRDERRDQRRHDAMKPTRAGCG